MILNHPISKKITGVNIAAKKSYGIGRDYGSAWAAMFADWDWSGWIKPQIDYAVGNGVGCNCISLIGSLEGVFAGVYTQDYYNACWQQVVAYCASLGVAVHVRGGWYPQVSAASSLYNAGQPSMTDQNIADGINALLASLTAYSNIIGVDVMQEQEGWGVNGGESNPATRSVSIYTKIKAGGTALPLGFSTTYIWTGSTCKTWLASLSAALDYLDFHFYGMAGYDANAPIALSDMAYWRSTYPTLDIIFGEFGSPENSSNDTIESFIRNVLTASHVGDVKMRGANLWAVQDGNDTTSDEWGLYSTAWVPRNSRIAQIRQFTGGSVASRY